MGRLIDVDKLLTEINDCERGNDHYQNGVECCREIIQVQPTVAFDRELFERRVVKAYLDKRCSFEQYKFTIDILRGLYAEYDSK